jgi:hypothetical protein
LAEEVVFFGAGLTAVLLEHGLCWLCFRRWRCGLLGRLLLLDWWLLLLVLSTHGATLSGGMSVVGHVELIRAMELLTLTCEF